MFTELDETENWILERVREYRSKKVTGYIQVNFNQGGITQVHDHKTERPPEQSRVGSPAKVCGPTVTITK